MSAQEVAYDVFQSIEDNIGWGLDLERDKPFTGQCTHTCDREKIHETGYSWTSAAWSNPQDQELDYEKYMSNWLPDGPFVVYTKSSSHVFQTYAGGILDSRECNTTSATLDHSLLLVGEGVDNGTDYWIARNNYGEGWGEKGYIRLGKGKNVCGIGLGLVVVN
ncbi:unnamed protein product [Oppiella nova]|uniref:Peptidase C1A papain C-terminal domain-containing protein n=1 Tax=Oppiella nova TaxID=334625 RepID=A0A7R9QS98_9ACAR|nr:unnamed protein product [Oppiella nova]CAG2173805.1 unnamed protein product [Oppiella nova]